VRFHVSIKSAWRILVSSLFVAGFGPLFTRTSNPATEDLLATSRMKTTGVVFDFSYVLEYRINEFK
jgi:hypothetical protein